MSTGQGVESPGGERGGVAAPAAASVSADKDRIAELERRLLRVEVEKGSGKESSKRGELEVGPLVQEEAGEALVWIPPSYIPAFAPRD